MKENSTPSTKPTPPAEAGDPGYGLGLAGFIVSFFFGVAGLVMSAVALQQSKRAGKKNGFAFAGLIIGIVKTAIDLLVIVGATLGFIWIVHQCTDNPSSCSENSSSGPSIYRPGQEPNTDPTY